MQKTKNAETTAGVHTHTHTHTHTDNLANNKNINKINTQNKPIDL